MKAITAWETGTDVVLSLEGSECTLHQCPQDNKTTHGCVNYGDIALTANEAELLAQDLLEIVAHVRDLYRLADQLAEEDEND